MSSAMLNSIVKHVPRNLITCPLVLAVRPDYNHHLRTHQLHGAFASAVVAGPQERTCMDMFGDHSGSFTTVRSIYGSMRAGVKGVVFSSA